jgi:Flp pilus assembly protein TadB
MSNIPGDIPGDIPGEAPDDKAGRSSLGDLLGEVTRDVSTLMRQEVELAKAELRETATRAGRSAGMFGGAGVAGLMALSFLSVALWWGLGYLMGNAWSAVIVAVIWIIVALVLFSIARREMKAVRGMPQTVDSIKKIPDTLKRDEEIR